MNYYDIIGVSPTASAEDISAAHKALAKMYHPDVNSSRDAHEKMTKLNEANDVLSDSSKREKYDNELKRSGRVMLNRNSVSRQPERPYSSPVVRNTEVRMGQAEILQRRTDDRLKAEEAARARRMEQTKRKEEEAAKRKQQAKVDFEKQHIINELSSLVMEGNAKQNIKNDIEIERHHATKVLLSLIRNDDNHLKRIAEEKERKQRIDEILSLVKEYNDPGNKLV